MKYSRTSRPSRKLDLMGSSIARPVVSAISPRIPASCLICWLLPRAPESAIMKMLLYLSRLLSSRSLSSLSVSVQVSTTALYLSSSVIRPLTKFLEITSTVACAFLSISFFCGGTVMSAMETVMAATVEYLYPIALIRSRTSAVLKVP